ncbi:aldo/keto reductase [Phytohabitans houttuyneae]|uniref:NADP-dependent oxidoreductase domain-containing protein n=1 Tax=Phytohabitans houttuyneae TaxID=1076126 RepID=A0A6V8KIC4_9ACTN|nr:aldo/keto reductase [Phytohabitans houttuyneae]GFJ81859.1 hypothetical protein Phou_060390 [Phytohabitans houttuyneae]
MFPLNLGGITFGWTSDEDTSHDVLDVYTEAGGNVVDTAEAYSFWVLGNSGGEPETIIGSGLAARRNRDRAVIATKGGGRWPALRPRRLRRVPPQSDRIAALPLRPAPRRRPTPLGRHAHTDPPAAMSEGTLASWIGNVSRPSCSADARPCNRLTSDCARAAPPHGWPAA